MGAPRDDNPADDEDAAEVARREEDAAAGGVPLEEDGTPLEARRAENQEAGPSSTRSSESWCPRDDSPAASGSCEMPAAAAEFEETGSLVSFCRKKEASSAGVGSTEALPNRLFNVLEEPDDGAGARSVACLGTSTGGALAVEVERDRLRDVAVRLGEKRRRNCEVHSGHRGHLFRSHLCTVPVDDGVGGGAEPSILTKFICHTEKQKRRVRQHHFFLMHRDPAHSTLPFRNYCAVALAKALMMMN